MQNVRELRGVENPFILLIGSSKILIMRPILQWVRHGKFLALNVLQQFVRFFKMYKMDKELQSIMKRKIRRRLSYWVSYWGNNVRKTAYFNSAKRMRSYVNRLHLSYDGVIEIEKVWCYRNHHPRHKWFYESWEPGQFTCIERY